MSTRTLIDKRMFETWIVETKRGKQVGALDQRNGDMILVFPSPPSVRDWTHLGVPWDSGEQPVSGGQREPWVCNRRQKRILDHILLLFSWPLFTVSCPWAWLLSVFSAGTEPQQAEKERHIFASRHGGWGLCHSGPPGVGNKLLLSRMRGVFQDTHLSAEGSHG